METIRDRLNAFMSLPAKELVEGEKRPEQKFFEERDIELVTKRLEDDRAEAWAEPGANEPVVFTKAWIRFLGDSINQQVRLVATATKRHLAERDARISALQAALDVRDDQVKRHAEHLARLQTKVDTLERFKADK